MFRTVHVVLLCALTVLLIAGGCSNAPKSYESSNLSSTAAQAEAASDYWKIDGWSKVNPTGARKAAIVEFNVEFLTSDQAHMDRLTGGSATGPVGLVIKTAEWGGMNKKTFEYEEQFMDELTLALYDGLVTQLQNQGFTVTPRESIIADPNYQEIKGKEDDKSTKFKDRDRRTTGVVVNVPGLLRQDAGFLGLNAIGNARALPRIAHNVGADMAMAVFLRLGLTKDGRAVIAQGSQIRVMSEMKEYKTGSGVDHAFNRNVTMTSKQGMYAGQATTTRAGSAFGKGKIMEVDSASFRTGIMTMYPAYANMAVERLK